MPYLGKGDCHVCNREVDVSENRSGMAYYRCAACGTKLQMTGTRGDRMLRQRIRPFADPDALPPPGNDGETPVIPGESQTANDQKPEPRRKQGAGFWSI
ncbi:hypothetical protein [Burkholderia arboris]|uniref:hypothetical protein n=1 Tax=Burkholderia arboris TaxID=488730 RepID=UPI00210D5475|nr:hypothetical protein [Burkholderia arboris]UTV53229.1 hypothetical protein NLX30_10025 [Burkholderia arboris]